jgi:glutamine synthetase
MYTLPEIKNNMTHTPHVYIEYIWVDGYGEPWSKTKVIMINCVDELELSDIPIWNYDGSSTNQASSESSEVLIRPQALYKDPFRRRGTNYMVLCDTTTTDGKAHETNNRSVANKLFESHLCEQPWFGLEQEFFILKQGSILGTKSTAGEYVPQKMHYCGVGAHGSCRKFVDEVVDNSIYAGLAITGMNAEVETSQWEVQLCETGIEACDQLIILRYIMKRTSERYGWDVTFDPKPLLNANGSGCHVNFSTKRMRSPGGYDSILHTIQELKSHNTEDMKYYGEKNTLRMTGENETARYDVFSHGVGDRTASVRIPHDTFIKKYGYMEDRRPGANMDPYLVTSILFNRYISSLR